MQRPLLSPETFFSEEPSFALDGLMNETGLQHNDKVLSVEYQWMDELFEKRLKENTEGGFRLAPLEKAGIPELLHSDGPFAHLVNRLQLSIAERILLLSALEPHFHPLLVTKRLSQIAEEAPIASKLFSYYKDPFSNNYYPTLMSALFLCAGTDPDQWRKYEQELIHHGKLFKEQIIVPRDTDHRERIGNRLNQLIDLAPEYVDYLLHGRKPRPDFGRSFPAKWISTNLTWDHLVINQITRDEITDVMDWVEFKNDVLDRSENKVNKSFPCLFYGPPGTGKSFTAKLIGKQYGKDVFRIDLSMIVSKYIGETEKNLSHLFDRAEGKDWILFFDEADALFGKRTGISDSKDKWANLEMSYLLQRMEEYEGLCILATNLKHNLDPAMTRRFQSMIHFPWPKPEERALIWKKTLPPGFEYASNISIQKLAKYDFSGANIANVIKSSCVKAAKRGDFILRSEDISRFIKVEYAKENRTP
ncbi:MAG TPA: ATP-binding protein [Bacteroidia bacterium]|jgi:hypothetical protein|nr:ATP-binding protein [Bacteroidia bacterium]